MIPIATLSNETLVVFARYSSQRLYLGGAEYAPDASGIVRVYGSGQVSASEDSFWDVLTIVSGAYSGPPFSGSSDPFELEGVTYNTRWTGATNNSASVAAVSVPAEYAAIYRSIDGGETWELWIPRTPLPLNSSDFEGLSCGVTLYRAVAFTEEGASAETIIEIEAHSEAVWLGGGTGFSQTARIIYETLITEERGRLRAVENYQDRERGIAYSSRQLTNGLTVNAKLVDTNYDPEVDAPELLSAGPQRVGEIAEEIYPIHVHRDPYGRRLYGSLQLTTITETARLPKNCEISCARGVWTVSYKLLETEAQ